MKMIYSITITLKKVQNPQDFFPANRLISLSDTVSQVPAEDIRFLDHRSETKDFITHDKTVTITSHWFPSKSHRNNISGPNGCLHKQWATFQERNTELGEFTTFIVVNLFSV